MKGIFPGYVEIKASAEDTERDKWEEAREWVVEVHGVDTPETVNAAINRRVIYLPERGDDWQHPLDTYEMRTGDCEDYAILKRAILIFAGIPSTKTALVLGEIAAMPQNQPHAFLVVEDGGKMKVLDNKFDQLIDPKDYINFIPKKMLCDEGVFLYAKSFAIADALKERA